MKWINVAVRPSCLDEVISALAAIGITRLTMTEVLASGEPCRHEYAELDDEGPEHGPRLLPHVQIEIALPDQRLHDVIDALRRSVHSGRTGIYVLALESAMRIRTAETGETAV